MDDWALHFINSYRDKLDIKENKMDNEKVWEQIKGFRKITAMTVDTWKIKLTIDDKVLVIEVPFKYGEAVGLFMSVEDIPAESGEHFELEDDIPF